MVNSSAFLSGMRGGESAPADETSSKVEKPSVFSSGMRGNEKPKTEATPEKPKEELENTSKEEALKSLPPGSEIIGSHKDHHIVRVPIGKAKA